MSIIVNRRRYGRRTSPCSYANACCCLQLRLWSGSMEVYTQNKIRKKTSREGGKTPAGERESCRLTPRCSHTFLSHLWWGCHSYVHGLNPTFSRKSSVSQQLLVASGELDHQPIYIRPGSPGGDTRNPRQNTKGGALGLELGSAAADCFSWAAPQVGRNSTSISPFTFPLWGFHSDVCDVLSLGKDMLSSGGQFWGWCASCKN